MKKTMTRLVVAACMAVGCLGTGQAMADTTLTLSAGWNLVSSTTPVSAVATTFSDTQKFTSVWTWDTTANSGTGNWQVFLANGNTATYAQAKGFASLSAIGATEGFWINSVAQQSLTITGQADTGTTLSLVDNWNLKGVNSTLEVAQVFNTKVAAGDTYKYASVWKWSGTTWSVFIPGETTPGTYAQTKGFGNLATLSPGEGFWVNVHPSQGGEVVVTPPIIAGTVNYPTKATMAKIAGLHKAGLFATSTTVEMPPTPGATVNVYPASDTAQTDPLASTTTNSEGDYLLTEDDFDDPQTTEVELPPQVPVVISAEFKSPIDPLKKIQVQALIDPTDTTNNGQVDVNPLTTAIGDKILTFIKDTFKVDLNKEIMDAAKAFIDLIVAQVEAQGLTNFTENDLVVGQYQSEESEELDNSYTPPANQDVAGTVLDDATDGLFTSMEGALIDKAEEFSQPITIDDATKTKNLEKFFAALGFAVQTANNSLLVFIPSPQEIPEANLPGIMQFNDRAFRLLTAADLTPEQLQLINHPAFLHFLKQSLQQMPALSHEAMVALQTAIDSDQTAALTTMAGVIKDKFVWQTEGVQMLNGVAMFSDKMQTPQTGADVNATELIAGITGKIGDTPEEVAKGIAKKPHNIMRLAEQVINQKINQIWADPGITDKPLAVAVFTQGLTTFDDLKELVMESDIFQHEVKSISHRIYAALEPELYGQMLSASTELKIKSSFLLMQLMIDRDYLIDADKGWFTTKTANGKSWVEPNFGNVKWLAEKTPGPGIVNQMVAQLLGVEITDSVGFADLVNGVNQAAGNIAANQEFFIDPSKMGEIAGKTGEVTETIVSGEIKQYDGEPWATQGITIKTYDQNGQLVDAQGGTVTTGGDGAFTATIAANHPYEIHFAGTEFVMPFFADPFTAELELGEIWLPPPADMGGAKGFPGIGLWVDQTFFDFMGANNPNNGKAEGVDFSNFNTNNPFIIFVGATNGTPDLFWTSVAGLKTNGQAQIASLGSGDTLQHGLGSPQLLQHLFTPDELAATTPITIGTQTFTLTWGSSVPTPMDDNAVYVIKDNGGQYFFIEVRDWEKNDQGQPGGMIDLGFAKLGSNGVIEVPSETFIGGQTEPGDGGPGMGLYMADLNPGDVFDLDGKGWSAPATEPFGYNATATANSDIAWLATFYDTYWKGNTDDAQRKAALANSDRAISVVNGALLATVEFSTNTTPGVLTATSVPGGVVTNVVPGDLFQVTTAGNATFLLLAKSVDPDAIELVIIPKDKVVNAQGNLLPGIFDQDKDGIPSILDDNDFNMDEFDPGDFTIIDLDGDGVPAQFDPNDNDPNIPNSGGKPAMIDAANKLMTLCLGCHTTDNHKADVKCDNVDWMAHATKPGVPLDAFNAVSQYVTGNICPLPGDNPGGGPVGSKPVALDGLCLNCHTTTNNAVKVSCGNQKWLSHKASVGVDIYNAVTQYLTQATCP